MNSKRTSLGTCRLSRLPLLLLLCLALVLGLSLGGCEKHELDSDGGYFDKETGNYKYMFPKKTSVADNALGVSRPRKDQVQQIRIGTVEVAAPNRIWGYIPTRDSYSILARTLPKDMKDDEKKRVIFFLSYVDPLLLAQQSSRFRQQWRDYVIKRITQVLSGKEIVITFGYEENSRTLHAVLTFYDPKVSTEERKITNLNLFMIEQGLSLYVLPQKEPPQHKNYLAAQTLAQKNKRGIWQYK